LQRACRARSTPAAFVDDAVATPGLLSRARDAAPPETGAVAPRGAGPPAPAQPASHRRQL